MARYGYDPLRPLNERQIHRRVRGQINPYLSSGRRAIQAYTEALARALSSGPAQTQAIYGRAQGEQAAVDQALANRLTGAGGAAQSDLAAQLAQAGQSQAGAQAVGQVGTGAANAGYASGSADLTRLIAQGAAAQNYAGTLPNIARLGGAQRSQQYEAQLLSQLPKLLQQEEDRNFQRAVAAQSGLINEAKVTETARGHTLTYKARIAAIQAANKRTGMTLRERAAHNGVTEQEQAKRDNERARANRVREKQARRRQWYKEHHPGGKGGGLSITR